MAWAAVGRVLVPLNDATAGMSLWAVNPTTGSLQMVLDPTPPDPLNLTYAYNFQPRVIGELTATRALLAVYEPVARGWTLWTTDGTANGTEFLKDLQPGLPETYDEANINPESIKLGDYLYPGCILP